MKIKFTIYFDTADDEVLCDKPLNEIDEMFGEGKPDYIKYTVEEVSEIPKELK